MTVEEVAQALSLQHAVSVYTIPARKLPRHHCASGFYYRTFEVEAYLLSQRAKRLWTVDDATSPMDGSLVPASSSQLSRFKKLVD